jgi:hypothetical protein
LITFCIAICFHGFLSAQASGSCNRGIRTTTLFNGVEAVGAITVLSIFLVTFSEADFQNGNEDFTIENMIGESSKGRELTPVSNVGHFGSKDNPFG